MRHTARTRFSWVSLVLIVVFLMASLPASAQQAGPTDVMPIQADGATDGIGTADMASPSRRETRMVGRHADPQPRTAETA